MDTRRVYISSLDTKQADPNFSNIIINVADAKISCLSNEFLALALVKCSLPGSLSAVPITQMTSEDVKDDISVIALHYKPSGGVYGNTIRIYFNQSDSLLNPGADNYQGVWSVNTSQTALLKIINDIIGGDKITVDINNRLIAENTGDEVLFLSASTSPGILKALGLSTTADSVITSAVTLPARGAVDVGGVLPIVYILVNENIDTFCSMSGGQSMNILASIPVDVTNTAMGDIEVSNVRHNMSSQIMYTNKSMSGAHKPISSDSIIEFDLTLVNSDGKLIGTMGQEWNLCIEVQTNSSQ